MAEGTISDAVLVRGDERDMAILGVGFDDGMVTVLVMTDDDDLRIKMRPEMALALESKIHQAVCIITERDRPGREAD